MAELFIHLMEPTTVLVHKQTTVPYPGLLPIHPPLTVFDLPKTGLYRPIGVPVGSKNPAEARPHTEREREQLLSLVYRLIDTFALEAWRLRKILRRAWRSRSLRLS